MLSEDLTVLSRKELEQRIAALQEELDDLMAERSLTLRGTGVHIGGKEAQRMRNEFQDDETRLQAKLEELRARLV
jgi:hypothetical protein